mmetsp:Transcript_7613/g.30921  ORF Transcript_7613/g.30921 Transcript_7613/m.30921 type:complete len:298 (+) Transcript_7613:482-1375(+)
MRGRAALEEGRAGGHRRGQAHRQRACGRNIHQRAREVAGDGADRHDRAHLVQGARGALQGHRRTRHLLVEVPLGGDRARHHPHRAHLAAQRAHVWPPARVQQGGDGGEPRRGEGLRVAAQLRDRPAWRRVARDDGTSRAGLLPQRGRAHARQGAQRDDQRSRQLAALAGHVFGGLRRGGGGQAQGVHGDAAAVPLRARGIEAQRHAAEQRRARGVCAVTGARDVPRHLRHDEARLQLVSTARRTCARPRGAHSAASALTRVAGDYIILMKGDVFQTWRAGVPRRARARAARRCACAH